MRDTINKRKTKNSKVSADGAVATELSNPAKSLEHGNITSAHCVARKDLNTKVVGTTGLIPKGSDMPANDRSTLKPFDIDSALKQLQHCYVSDEPPDERPTHSKNKKKVTFKKPSKPSTISSAIKDSKEQNSEDNGVVTQSLASSVEVPVDEIKYVLSGVFNNVRYVWHDGGLRHHNNDYYLESYDGLDFHKLLPGKFKLFHTVFVKSFTNFSTQYTVDRRVTYCHPLYMEMRKTMPLPSPEMRNRDALLRSILQRFPSVSLVSNALVMDTLLVYMYDLLLKGQRPTTVTDLVDSSRLSRDILGVVNTGFRGLEIISPVDCKFPNTWRFNNRVNVVGGKGFSFDYDGNTIKKYPTFTTTHNESYHHVNSAFCIISGATPFQYYELNGFNVTPALSRIMKYRDDEDLLFSNQLSYLSLDVQRAARLMSRVNGEYAIKHDGDSMLGKVTFKPWKYRSFAQKEVRSVYTGTPSVCARELYTHICSFDRSTLWDRFKEYIGAVGVTLYYGLQMIGVIYVLSYILEAVYSPNISMYDKLEHLGYVTQLPAVKKSLYQKWYGDDVKVHNILTNTVEAEVKIKAEAGKHLKAPRLFGGFAEGCLVDKITPDVVKYLCKDEILMHELVPNHNNLHFSIVYSNDQAAKASDKMFQQLLGKGPGIYCIYFSDDGFVFVVNEDLSNTIYETDISSCDSSNGVAIFMMLHGLLERISGIETADALVAQCSKGFKIINPSNSDEYVKMDLLTYFEYSGSVLTTALNNLASMFIFCEAYQCILDGELDIRSALVNGARRGGWVVTCDRRDNLNDVSFLKRSFNGKRSYLNYGCILRSLCVIKGTSTADKFGLDHRTYLTYSDEELFEIHLKSRVDSLVNEPISEFINSLRIRVGYAPLKVTLEFGSLHERYRFSEIDYLYLCTSLENLKVGDAISCLACCAIMRKDYGVE